MEIEVASLLAFRVGGQLPVLRINDQEVAIGEVPETGDTTHLVFKVSDSNLQGLPDDVDLEIGHKGDAKGAVHSLGRVKKSKVMPK